MLRTFVRDCTSEAARANIAAIVLSSFGAWRTASGILSVERSGEQVCQVWTDRVQSAEQAAAIDAISVTAGLTACFNASYGVPHMLRLLQVVYLPAWRRHVELSHRCRDALDYEEVNMAQVQEQ